MIGEKEDIIGRKIVDVELNRFSDSGGYWNHEPVFFLDDGTRIAFVATKTDVGKYGIELVITKAEG
jgi:hypothetical protein